MSKPMPAVARLLSMAMILTLLWPITARAQSVSELIAIDFVAEHDKAKNSEFDLEGILKAMNTVDPRLLKLFGHYYQEQSQPDVMLIVGLDGRGVSPAQATKLPGIEPNKLVLTESQGVGKTLYASLLKKLNAAGVRVKSDIAENRARTQQAQTLAGYNDAAGVRLLGQNAEVGLVLFAKLTPVSVNNVNKFQVEFQAIDVPTGRALGAASFILTGDFRESNYTDAWSGQILTAFFQEYSRIVHRGNVITLNIFGFKNEDSVDEFLDQIEGRLKVANLEQPNQAVKSQIKQSVARKHGAGYFAQFRVTTAMDSIKLGRTLRNTFREMKLPAMTLSSEAEDALIIVGQGAVPPSWTLYTEPTLDGHAEAITTLKRLYAAQQRPKIAVVINHPEALLGEYKPRAGELDQNALAGQIAGHLLGADVELVDPTAAKAAFLKQMYEENRFRGDNQVTAVMQSERLFDLLIYGTARTDSNGAIICEFRLVDIRSGRLLAVTRLPDEAANNKAAFVSASSPQQVAKFVAGSLLEQLARGFKPSLTVYVKDAPDASLITTLADMVRNNNPELESIGNLEYRYGVGKFTIYFNGDANRLKASIQKDIEKFKDPKLHVDRMDNTTMQIQVLKKDQVNTYQNITTGVIPALMDPALVLPDQKPLPPQDPTPATIPTPPIPTPPTTTPITVPVQGPTLPAPAANPNPQTALTRNNTWALIIGINKYPNAPLIGCVEDAHLIAKTLVERCGFRQDQMILMTDTDPKSGNTPTLDNMVKVTKALAGAIKEGDTVVFYFSGHGGIFDDTKEGFLLSFDEKGFPINVMREVLRNSKATWRVMLLDACHTGVSRDAGNTASGLKPAGVLPDQFIRNVEKLDRNEVTIAACKGSQTAMASKAYNHGFFTWWLVRGLCGEADREVAGNRDNVVEATELFKFAAQRVTEDAKKQYNHTQNPFLNASYDGNIILSEFKP